MPAGFDIAYGAAEGQHVGRVGMESTCREVDTCGDVARVAVEVESPCRLVLEESLRTPVVEERPG